MQISFANCSALRGLIYLAEGYLSMAMELACPCTSATIPDEEGMHGLGVGPVGGLEPPLGAGKQV
jgi:hypothetical protein